MCYVILAFGEGLHATLRYIGQIFCLRSYFSRQYAFVMVLVSLTSPFVGFGGSSIFYILAGLLF